MKSASEKENILDKALNEQIERYISHHGVKVEMDTNYMLDAFTLRASENYEQLVLVMDTQVVVG